MGSPFLKVYIKKLKKQTQDVFSLKQSITFCAKGHAECVNKTCVNTFQK